MEDFDLKAVLDYRNMTAGDLINDDARDEDPPTN